MHRVGVYAMLTYHLDQGFEAGVNLKPYLGGTISAATSKHTIKIQRGKKQYTNIIQKEACKSASTWAKMPGSTSHLVVS